MSIHNVLELLFYLFNSIIEGPSLWSPPLNGTSLGNSIWWSWKRRINLFHTRSRAAASALQPEHDQHRTAPDAPSAGTRVNEALEMTRASRAKGLVWWWGASRASMRLSGLLLRIAEMLSLISPVTKAILVALFIFAILLILYVILWYICTDVDCDHGIWFWRPKLRIRGEVRVTPVSASACASFTRYLYEIPTHSLGYLRVMHSFVFHYSALLHAQCHSAMTPRLIKPSSSCSLRTKRHPLERFFTENNIWIDALAVRSSLVPCMFRYGYGY